MKVVVGIIAVAVVAAALALYILVMLNSHDLVFCGDIRQNSGNAMSVTRVYSTDLNANQTLAEIITAMNESESGSISAEELSELLATYQDIIYAPMMVFTLEQIDTRTYILTGNVYNGIDEDGEPITPDYMFKEMTMTAGIANGKILAAQNLYDDDEQDEEEPTFKERPKVVDPVLVEDETAAAFAFKDCSGFRMVLTGVEGYQTAVSLGFTYNIAAKNPMNFTRVNDVVLSVTITAAYDDNGTLTPQLTINRNTVTEEE